MPSRPIAIFGAVSRFNYGDLLFPLVLEKALRGAGCERPVTVVGLRDSDLSRYGALPTKAARWLAEPESLPDGSSLIIAGGEALAAGWGRMYSHLLPPRFGDAIYSIACRLFSQRQLDRLGQKRAGVPWHIPFCPRPDHFQNQVDIVFNAVGGSGLAGRPKTWRDDVIAAISEARYASVRDKVAYEALGGSSSPAELHPDSAAVMSELFPIDWLRANAQPDVRALIESGRPYLCFQLHRYFADIKLQRFAHQLDRVVRDDGLQAVLLPIGRAAGHSDQVSLRKVNGAMSQSAWLPERLGVFDIMALLAHCAAFAGTSLHGLITAMSFDRPYGMIGKNPKCLAFVDQWAPEPFRQPARASGFRATLAERRSVDPAILTASAEELRRSARAGLDRVISATLGE